MTPPALPVETATDPAGHGYGSQAVFDFLRDPRRHFDGTPRVDVVETHLSWVFVSRLYAWKLKKAVRTPLVDFTTLAARRRNCENEVRLNRRLAPGVYHGVVPLTESPGGKLRWGGNGRVLEWLVWMRRLPRDRMLDALIRQRAVPLDRLRALARRLAGFHLDAPRPAAAGYCARLREAIAQDAALLAEFSEPEDAGSAARIAQGLLQFLATESGLFETRLESGRVVEGHGDLRPAHLCLDGAPLVIDCLEFSAELRTMDICEDLACLEVECERLGAAWVGRFVLAAHALETGDRPPRRLQDFHAAARALLRARLAHAHVLDCPRATHARWRAEGRRYLDIAERHLARCATLATAKG